MKYKLKNELFKTIVENTPLIAIDIIVRNERNEILVGKRLNKPAQNFWFVPGGRIYKDETLDNAFKRILKNEININSGRSMATFIGVFEHFYEDSYVNDEITTHYIMLVYEIRIKSSSDILLPVDQHDEYIWLLESNLLENKFVHKNTKKYFEPKK